MFTFPYSRIRLVNFKPTEPIFFTLQVKQDVAGLVDQYFSSLYINYHFTKKCLIRQARDLFVCEYHGCLKRFEDEFCIPAAKLLQHLKVRCYFIHRPWLYIVVIMQVLPIFYHMTFIFLPVLMQQSINNGVKETVRLNSRQVRSE